MLEDKLRSLLDSLDRVWQQVLEVIEDEESKASAYTRLALKAPHGEEKYKLVLVAIDTILHREVMWAVLRALEESKQLIREAIRTKPEALEAGLVEAHETLEKLAEASYQELASLAPEETTLKRLLEMLASEEKKHDRLVGEIVALIRRHQASQESH